MADFDVNRPVSEDEISAHEPKDKAVLYAVMGKAIFDPVFRARIFENPERAASSSGVNVNLIHRIAKLGREAFDEFVEKYEKELKAAAQNAGFC